MAATSRRTMLLASACGLGALSVDPRRMMGAEQPALPQGGKARSTILFFLCGGASQIDTWDMKPHAPAEYRGPLEPIATSAPGVTLCEHLPLLARQAHHLAVVPSISGRVDTNDHHAGYYYNLTGHAPDPTFKILGNDRTPYADDWPYMGAVVAAKRPRHPALPNAVTLPHMPSQKPYTRPGQFAARLGIEHDPLYLIGQREQPLTFTAPALELQAGLDSGRLARRRELLDAVDDARRHLDHAAEVSVWNRQQQRAFSLLTSPTTTSAFDVAGEPETIRRRYGENVNGMSLLLARRLVEAGVPFITVFWLGHGGGSPQAKKCASAGSWDTHGNNFECLANDLLPEFDQCFSALIEDLHQRGLLDSTLLLVTSEMGRQPKIGDPRSGGTTGAGRDHWTHCLTDLLAGGGITGGQVYGSSDRLGEYPAEHPVTPADIAQTVYAAMGVHDLGAVDAEGRPFSLLDEGRPLMELF